MLVVAPLALLGLVPFYLLSVMDGVLPDTAGPPSGFGGVAVGRLHFDCGGLEQPETMVNFLSSAVGEKYEDILPMYAFYALSSHRSIRACVEIVVQDSVNFVERHKASLAWLQDNFSFNDAGAVCVRNYSSNHINRTRVPNTWRFLEVPSRPAKYTYM